MAAALPQLAAHSLPPHPGPALPPHTHLVLTLPTDVALLSAATLSIELLTPPSPPTALVCIVHPRACSSVSPGMHQLGVALQESGYAVAMPDLLTDAEAKQDELTEQHRHDLILLDKRLDAVINHVRNEQPRLSQLPLALVGSATVAAVALVADVHHYGIRAIVSRGGLPHLARQHLQHVSAPVLLIVGSAGCGVWEDNKQALQQLTQCQHKRLHVVPNARHHFQESGAMDDVIRQTVGWLGRLMVFTGGKDEGASGTGERMEDVGEVKQKGHRELSDKSAKAERMMSEPKAEQYGETSQSAK